MAGRVTTTTWQFSAWAASKFFAHPAGHPAVFHHQHANAEAADVPAIVFDGKRSPTEKDLLPRDPGPETGIQRFGVVERADHQGQLSDASPLDIRAKIPRSRGEQHRLGRGQTRPSRRPDDRATISTPGSEGSTAAGRRKHR